jgi:hypothetical protein
MRVALDATPDPESDQRVPRRAAVQRDWRFLRHQQNHAKAE